MDTSTRLQIIRRTDAELFDESDSSFRRKLRTGELTRLRPGAFVRSTEFDSRYSDERHLLTTRAATELCAPGTVVSHASAALLRGLPVWGTNLDRVHVTKSRRNSGHVAAGLHTHCAVMEDDEIDFVDGLLVTSVARTLIDFARTSSFESGVVLVDAALHRNLVTPQELADALTRAKLRHGCPTAGKVLTFADGRSESMGESRSRVFMRRFDLPEPELQFEVVNADGDFIARTDFAWLEHRTVGEFDGLTKYGRLLKPGEGAGDAVVREKIREDLVREEQYGVLRWTSADLNRPEVLAGRFRRAFAR